MTIEQKARAYDEAIKKASAAYGEEDKHLQATLERIFPELKEIEDERVRNKLIEFFKGYSPDEEWWGNITQEDILAWLEKQDKQNPCESCEEPRLNCQNFPCERKKNFKPANKVEPKFKVENWYQCTKDFFGKGVTFDKNTAYYCAIEGCLQDEYGCHIAIVKDLYDNFKLWTIADAKDGDVLFAENFDNIGGCVFLFKGLDSWKFDAEGDRAIATGYCCTSITESGNTDFGIQGPDCVEIKRVHPATKEQRDLLFQKMKEAGYEWNAEKKELKKIDNEEYNGEDYGIDSLFHAQRILEKTLGKVDGYQSDDGILEHKCAITAVKKLYEQKQQMMKDAVDGEVVKDSANNLYIGKAQVNKNNFKFGEKVRLLVLKEE